jgi:hypothetical protein
MTALVILFAFAVGWFFVGLIACGGGWRSPHQRDRLWLNRHFTNGEPSWRECRNHNKVYDKNTGEELHLKTITLKELIDANKLPCCKFKSEDHK